MNYEVLILKLNLLSKIISIRYKLGISPPNPNIKPKSNQRQLTKLNSTSNNY